MYQTINRSQSIHLYPKKININRKISLFNQNATWVLITWICQLKLIILMIDPKTIWNQNDTKSLAYYQKVYNRITKSKCLHFFWHVITCQKLISFTNGPSCIHQNMNIILWLLRWCTRWWSWCTRWWTILKNKLNVGDHSTYGPLQRSRMLTLLI